MTYIIYSPFIVLFLASILCVGLYWLGKWDIENNPGDQ
jgi:hypothetical protein